MHPDRIRLARLRDKVMSAQDAAALITDGMTVGMSGFTRAGDCKAVPFALAERAKQHPLQITLMTGASLLSRRWLRKPLMMGGVIAAVGGLAYYFSQRGGSRDASDTLDSAALQGPPEPD